MVAGHARAFGRPQGGPACPQPCRGVLSSARRHQGGDACRRWPAWGSAPGRNGIPGLNRPRASHLPLSPRSEVGVCSSKGEKFLRLTFHELNEPDNFKSIRFDEKAYLGTVQANADRFLGKTFLNLGEELSRAQRKAIFRNFPLFGLGVGLFSLALAIIAMAFSYFATWRLPTVVDHVVSDVDRLAGHLAHDQRARGNGGQQAEKLLDLEQALMRLDCRAARDPLSGRLDGDRLTFATVEDCRRNDAE